MKSPFFLLLVVFVAFSCVSNSEETIVSKQSEDDTYRWSIDSYLQEQDIPVYDVTKNESILFSEL